MSRIALFFSALLLSHVVLAESTLSSIQIAPVHYSQGAFTSQRTLPNMPTPLVSRGEFYFDRNVGFLWYTREPVQQAQFFGASANYQYQLDDNRVRAERIRLQASRHISRIINAIIDSDWSYLERHFSAQVTQQDGTTDVDLTPRNKQVAKHLQKLQFRLQQHLESYRIELASGEVQEVSFTDVAEGTNNLFASCTTEDKLLQAICEHLLKATGPN